MSDPVETQRSAVSLLPSRVRFSVALKLTLLVGLILSVLLAALLAGGWVYWRNVLRAQTDAHFSAIAASRRDMVEGQIALLLQRISLNTDRGDLRSFLNALAEERADAQSRSTATTTVNRVAKRDPLRSAAVATTTGDVVLSSRPEEIGRNVADLPEFQAGMEKAHVGWPRPSGGGFQATLAAPIWTQSEPRRAYGALLATADVSDLAAAVQDTTGLGKSGEAILAVKVGQELHFLFPPRNAPETAVVRLEASPSLAAAAAGQAAFFRIHDYRGVPVLAASQPINYQNWALVVKIDEAEAYAPADQALRLGALLGVGLMALGLGSAYALARGVTRPVRRLAEAAGRIAGGDYATQVPVRSADELGALAVNFNEMTAALRARREERDAAEDALRLNDRRKDEFLAMLGHELRNPLSAIVHAVRLEQHAGNDRAATDMARAVVERQTRNLTRLVDDLLDIARFSEGKIGLRRQPVDVAAAVQRAVDALRPMFTERRHTLDLSIATGPAHAVFADPIRLDQILTNLLTNAAKYTPDGGHIKVVERQEGNDAVITVSDNGIGIAPEMLAGIFDRFTQVDRSLDRTAGGLGLGLSLCRQLVELHGGTITGHSNGLGCGAAFTLRLPTMIEPATVAPTTPAPAPSSPAPRRRILLVDDNVDTVRSLSRLLALRGHEVATAHDGLSALELAPQFKPNVMLLDIGLPGLDGYELTRRLRSEGFPDTPIIAISGYAQEGDRARSREAGFNYHFAKPVDFEALAELIIEEPLAID